MVADSAASGRGPGRPLPGRVDRRRHRVRALAAVCRRGHVELGLAGASAARPGEDAPDRRRPARPGTAQLGTLLEPGRLGPDRRGPAPRRCRTDRRPGSRPGAGPAARRHATADGRARLAGRPGGALLLGGAAGDRGAASSLPPRRVGHRLRRRAALGLCRCEPSAEPITADRRGPDRRAGGRVGRVQRRTAPESLCGHLERQGRLARGGRLHQYAGLPR